jgi:hypothetical protein
MDQKTLKKIIKRQTAKKRAERQTIRRKIQLKTDRFNEQVAQDLYKPMKTSRGKTKSRQKQGEYKLKKYGYDMFEYGDPVRGGVKQITKGIKDKKTANSRINPKQGLKKTPKRGQNTNAPKMKSKKG